ncbi:MAG TPA: L-lactate permease [Candidatus Dormibacteraeota bacterium]|nr:L-lactate permease [Candidatus Dormibacteraeota bacterium]
MNVSLGIAGTLLPFAVLFSAFLIFKMDALRASLSAWIVEFVLVLVFYRMSLLKIVEASLWGNLTMWTGFMVLYTGQIFGQAYRTTGLLDILLESIRSMLPSHDREGRSIALVTLVSGFIGAFNGFATYPVTIPGLIGIGFDGVQAATSYLVYFSWTLPYNSLFIAPNISNAASHVPIVNIVHVTGLLTIPLIYISLLGFLKLLGFRFFERKTQILFWTAGTANAIAVILFTQIWPAYYLLMMIAGGTFSLAGFYVYGRLAKRRIARDAPGTVEPQPTYSRLDLFKAFAPLLLGVLLVIVTKIRDVDVLLNHFRFGVALWGYSRISINVFKTAGFYIFVTAMVCYLFRRKRAHAGKDFVIASKRSGHSLATLCVGSATVYLMVDSGQIALLGRVLAQGGKFVYASLYPSVAFLGGMAFGQGLPGDFLFSRMQVSIAPLLGIPLVVLVGIITVMTMGPPNALKPTQIAYTASLANVKGRDGEIFRICLPWQILQLVVTAILSVILIYVLK